MMTIVRVRGLGFRGWQVGDSDPKTCIGRASVLSCAFLLASSGTPRSRLKEDFVCPVVFVVWRCPGSVLFTQPFGFEPYRKSKARESSAEEPVGSKVCTGRCVLA